MGAGVEQYRAFIANSAEGIWRCGVEKPIPTHLSEDDQLDAIYRLVYMAECNDAMARMYGFERGAEMIGARLGDLLPRDEPKNVEYLRAFIRAGYRLTDVESVERDRDGRQKHFANSLVGIVEDGAILGAWGTQRDLTRQKALERELARSEAHYRLLLDVAVDGVLFIDTDDRMTYVNPSMARMLEYDSPDDLRGRSLFDIFFEGDIPAARRRREMRRQGVSEQYEVRLRRRGGSECWVLASVIVMQDPQTGEYSGTYAMSVDITERKLTQIERERAAEANLRLVSELREANERQRERLRASEEPFRLLVEQVRDYAIFMLDPEGRVATWNAGAERFNGYQASEIVGKHFSCFYTPEDIARRHPWAELEAASHDGRYEEEGWRVRKDGSTFWASVVITALRGESGDLRGFAKVTRDITERRDRDQERAAARAAEQQRRFLKDVLQSVTQGRLVLCDDGTELPAPLGADSPEGSIALTAKSLKLVRARVSEIAAACGLTPGRAQDLVTAASECAMNAVQHAGGGTARVRGDAASGIVQVWVEDRGAGINLKDLPRATLERGFSTGGSGFGHGFWLMLQTCDRIYLLTGPDGTTIVLEQARAMPQPQWLAAP